jgi:hypothetical protein
MENEKTDLVVTNRIKLNVNGVKKIKSSEPDMVVLILSNSAMVITGTNLFVISASIQTGEVEITGLISCVKYTNISAKRKFSFKNMFR